MLVTGSALKGTYLAEKFWFCGGFVRYWRRASSRMLFPLLAVLAGVLLEEEEEEALMEREQGVAVGVLGFEGSLRLAEKLGDWRRYEEGILRERERDGRK